MSKGVFLTLSGFEHSKWVEKKMRSRDSNSQGGPPEYDYINHEQRNNFFAVRMPVYAWPSAMQPGQFSTFRNSNTFFQCHSVLLIIVPSSAFLLCSLPVCLHSPNRSAWDVLRERPRVRHDVQRTSVVQPGG